MTTPHWRQLGFLTPDAPGCQAEVWALSALLRRRLGETLAGLALATAEPTWGASLDELAGRASGLARELSSEAGDNGQLAVEEDELVRQCDGALCEVIASGHVPSLLATGYVVLGELALVPIALLDEVAGPHVKPLTARLLADDQHRLLGRLAGIVELTRADRTNLRRMLLHLNGTLADVFAGWRQTFHVLGVDGELLAYASRRAAAAAMEPLGIKATRRDLSVFR